MGCFRRSRRLAAEAAGRRPADCGGPVPGPGQHRHRDFRGSQRECSAAQRSSATPPRTSGYPGSIAAAKRDMRSSETSKVPRPARFQDQQDSETSKPQSKRPTITPARRSTGLGDRRAARGAAHLLRECRLRRVVLLGCRRAGCPATSSRSALGRCCSASASSARACSASAARDCAPVTASSCSCRAAASCSFFTRSGRKTTSNVTGRSPLSTHETREPDRQARNFLFPLTPAEPHPKR